MVVYLLLAAALFEECGYLAVWSRLTAALGSLPLPTVTATGLWHARTRLGARPMRELFDLLRGQATAIRTAGARWAGLLVVAIDGTFLDVPDGPATRAWLGKGSDQYTAASGYPQILLVALVACGTRAVLDAAFGPRGGGETGHGQRLARSLRTGMVVLLDRGLSGNDFLGVIAGTGAAFLARLSSHPQATGPAPLPRRLVPVPAGHRGSPHHRVPDHHRDHRRRRTGVSGWPPPCSIPAAIPRSSGQALPERRR